MGDENDQGEIENRVHARIHLSTEVQISGASGLVSATLRDLSRGGARLVCSEPIGMSGDTVELFLLDLDGNEIGIMGEIVREQIVEEGHMAALRFSLVEPSMVGALDSLIEALLAGVGGQSREHPRIARRLNVRCESQAELQAVLLDISHGGYAMELPLPLVLDEEILVVIPDSRGEDLLSLPSRVVNQRPIPNTDPLRYRVGLAFGDLDPLREHLLHALISQMTNPV